MQFPATEGIVLYIRQEKALWVEGLRNVLAVWERTAKEKQHFVPFGLLHSGQWLLWSTSGQFTLEIFGFVVCVCL